MTRLSFITITLAGAAVPVAVLAQTAGLAPQSITRVQIATKLDADYAELDSNKDGKANAAEITKLIDSKTAEDMAVITKRRDESFKKLDANNDGQVSRAEFDTNVPLPKPPAADPAPVLARFDGNKDGTITSAEFRGPTLTNFDKIDTNKDGTLTAAEQAAAATASR